MIPYGVEEMGFSESHTSVDKERVVCLAGLLRHGHTSRMGELISSSDNKVPERIFRVEENATSWLRLRLTLHYSLRTRLRLSRTGCWFVSYNKCNRKRFTRTCYGYGFSKECTIMSIQPLSKEFIGHSDVNG